ncbi:MAG: SEC-C metal-binding domain-containing protein [Bradymonadia bacterium]
MANRPGRNDPCHCGSGLKYKKCHLAADEAAAAAARKAVQVEAEPGAPSITQAAPMKTVEDPTVKTAVLIGAASLVLAIVVGIMTDASTGFTIAGAGGLIALLYAGLRNPPSPHENPGDPAALNFGMSGDGQDDDQQGAQQPQVRRRPQGPRPPARRR